MPPSDPTAILADGPIRELQTSDDPLRLLLYGLIIVLAILIVRDWSRQRRRTPVMADARRSRHAGDS